MNQCKVDNNVIVLDWFNVSKYKNEDLVKKEIFIMKNFNKLKNTKYYLFW